MWFLYLYCQSVRFFFFFHQQLRANMQDMEMLFQKVREEDIQALTKVLRPVKDMAAASIGDFLEIHTKSVEDLRKEVLFEPNNVAAKGSVFGNFLFLTMHIKKH